MDAGVHHRAQASPALRLSLLCLGRVPLRVRRLHEAGGQVRLLQRGRVHGQGPGQRDARGGCPRCVAAVCGRRPTHTARSLCPDRTRLGAARRTTSSWRRALCCQTSRARSRTGRRTGWCDSGAPHRWRPRRGAEPLWRCAGVQAHASEHTPQPAVARNRGESWLNVRSRQGAWRRRRALCGGRTP